MAGQKMLKFTSVERGMPQKRAPDLRNQDFDEIYAQYARDKAEEQASHLCVREPVAQTLLGDTKALPFVIILPLQLCILFLFCVKIICSLFHILCHLTVLFNEFVKLVLRIRKSAHKRLIDFTLLF